MDASVMLERDNAGSVSTNRFASPVMQPLPPLTGDAPSIVTQDLSSSAQTTTPNPHKRSLLDTSVPTLPYGELMNGIATNVTGPASKKKKKGDGDSNTAIPIFVQKTYDMIERCETSISSSIASWSDDGETFIVKDQDQFGKSVIPLYFDHNKFSSFKRQLYNHGFRKVQHQITIRNSDFDMESSKWVTFFNPHFKRGRADLLPRINRCTQTTAATNAVAAAAMAASAIEKTQQKQSINNLEGRVAFLEKQNADMTNALHSLINTIQSMQEQLNTALASDISTPSIPAPASPVYARSMLPNQNAKVIAPTSDREQAPSERKSAKPKQEDDEKSDPETKNKDTLGPLEMMATVATNTMSN